MGINIVRNGKGRRRLNSEINVTPFVDVMLVLLVIFMVTSPMLVAGIEVNLPRTQSSPLTGEDEPLVISIDKTGNFYIQETKVDQKSLPIKLKAIVGEKKEMRIFVRGDQAINYGKVMELFSLVKQAGFSNVSLVTEISEKQ